MVLPGGNGAGMAGKGRKNSVVDLLLGNLGFSGGASKSEVFSLFFLRILPLFPNFQSAEREFQNS